MLTFLGSTPGSVKAVNSINNITIIQRNRVNMRGPTDRYWSNHLDYLSFTFQLNIMNIPVVLMIRKMVSSKCLIPFGPVTNFPLQKM